MPFTRRLIALAASALLAACATAPEPPPQKPPALRVDVRNLRQKLPGGDAADVRRRLGQPGYVTTLGPREVWEYRDLVTDSFTNRPVALLEVEFINRRVTAVNFVY